MRSDGTVKQARSSIAPAGDGSLQHDIVHSSDGGKTWTPWFSATYHRID